MPGDGFPFAIRVGGQIDLGSDGCTLANPVYNLFFAFKYNILRFKAAFNIYAKFRGWQIFYVADARFNL